MIRRRGPRIMLDHRNRETVFLFFSGGRGI